jgi:2-iminoacetate synthase ThiH
MLSFDLDAVVTGDARLTPAQAMELHKRAPLHDLGNWALAVTRRLHPEPYRTYVIDRNINYTNVCTARCTFCAFRRDADAADAYALGYDQIRRKIEELLSIGGTQVLMQGGMNDQLPISYYEDLLRAIKRDFPHVHVHAFSPPEFVEFEKYFGLDARQIIRRFRAAGLDTIPGGGGEIFSPRVRRKIGIGKCDAADWLRIMRIAHEEGMSTSATMMIGHLEFIRERIEHMMMIRDMQDYALALRGQATERPSDGGSNEAPAETIKRVMRRHPEVFAKSPPAETEMERRSATGNYTAFIHWPFQRENTPLGRAKEWSLEQFGAFDESTNEEILKGRVVRMAGAHEYLRTLAIARLLLDNVASLQASWVTMGPKIGQLALFFGANDMGSVMMEENVVSAAGTTYKLNEREICRLVRDAGWLPAQRDQYYHVIRLHEGADSPDLRQLENPPLRNVKKTDGGAVGPAPGLDTAGQLPILE